MVACQTCAVCFGVCTLPFVAIIATSHLTLIPNSVTNRESRSVKDAFGRGYSRKRSECGARGRKDTVRSRAASGIMLSGTTAGAGGAFPGLGQAGAGNARLAARSLSPPGWGELDKTMRSCRVAGSLAWS
jgi:hypothetical protein